MNLGIMQPYFLPYIGYFQLLNAVDTFVVYDDIKYTKKGWINRNRMLQNGMPEVFSLPLKKDSDFLNICEREISEAFDPKKFLNKIKSNYHRAPFFVQTYSLMNAIIHYKNNNLFSFLYNSIAEICEYLDIKTNLVISSEIKVDSNLKGQDRVIATCKQMGAMRYINAIGGKELYSKNEFEMHGIELDFIESKPTEYHQFTHEFVPNLSIVDVMMFNSKSVISELMLSNYELV